MLGANTLALTNNMCHVQEALGKINNLDRNPIVMVEGQYVVIDAESLAELLHSQFNQDRHELNLTCNT